MLTVDCIKSEPFIFTHSPHTEIQIQQPFTLKINLLPLFQYPSSSLITSIPNCSKIILSSSISSSFTRNCLSSSRSSSATLFVFLHLLLLHLNSFNISLQTNKNRDPWQHRTRSIDFTIEHLVLPLLYKRIRFCTVFFDSSGN